MGGKKKKDKKDGGKKGKKDKKDKKDKGKKGAKSKKDVAPPEPSPTPPPPPVVLVDHSCQTEAPRELLAYVDSEYYCKIVTRLLTEQNDKLDQQVKELTEAQVDFQKRCEEAESKAQQAVYEMEQARQVVTPLEEQLELKEIELEELRIKYDIALLEKEELQDQVTDLMEAATEAMDDERYKEVLSINEQLKQQLSQMAQVGQELLDSKDTHINTLTTEHSYVESLKARLKDLLSVEQEVLGLKAKVHQLEEKNKDLADADEMCKVLTDANYKLEGELTDWREWVLDVESERQILEELHEDDDQHIQDLVREKKDFESQFFDMDKENKQFKIEIQDLRKELFELRHELEHGGTTTDAKEFEKFNFTPQGYQPTALDGDEEDDFMDHDEEYNPTDDQGQEEKPAHDGFKGNSKDRALEAMWNENTKMQKQLSQFRSIMMSNINGFIQSQGHYVQYNLLKQYLPMNSQDVDYRGIKVMALIQMLLYKAKTARDLLERLYADPSSAALRNPDLAMRSHILCPLILHQENYVRAIQEGLLQIKQDGDDQWKNLAQHFDTNAFTAVAKVYEELLDAIDASGESGELNFEIDALEKQEQFLKDYVTKHFKDYSPDKQKGDQLRCTKPIVMSGISETHYRYQSMSIKLNQFNGKLWELMNTPGPNAGNNGMGGISSPISVPQSNGIMDDQADDDEHDTMGNGVNPTDSMGSGMDDATALNGYGSENPTDDMMSGMEMDDGILSGDEEIMDDPGQRELEEVFKKLKVGAVEKIFRLRNDVVASVQQILQYCNPVELGFGKEKYSLNLLHDANKTAIRWGQLAKCKHLSLMARERVSKMVEAITNDVDTKMTPKQRVEVLNKIIGAEEEHNDEGLIMLLENAYKVVSDVRKVIGSTLYTTEQTTDEMPQQDYESFDRPYWESKAAKFRKIFEDQLKTQKKLEKAQNDVVEVNSRMDEMQKEKQNLLSQVEVQKKQIIQEKGKAKELSATQRENIQLAKDNESYKKKIDDNTQTIENQKEQLQRRANAIDQYKKAIARIKEKDAMVGKQVTVIATDAKGGGGGGGGNARYGTRLVNTEVEYSDLLEQTVQSLRRRMTELTMTKKLTNCQLNLKPLHVSLLRAQMIEKLQKELEEKSRKKKKRVKKKKKKKVVVAEEDDDGDDEDFENEALLEKEEKVDEDEEIEDKMIGGGDEEEAANGGVGKEEIVEQEEEVEAETKETEMEEEEESEYEWVTDEEAEADELADALLSGGGAVDDARAKKEELERLVNEERDAVEMEARLKSLSSSLNAIISRPLIVDLTKKSLTNDLSQEMIGRQMRLREIGIQYHELQNDLMKQQQERSVRNGEEEVKQEMGKALGVIRIPQSSLKDLGYDRKHSVVLPAREFGRLQKNFMSP